MRAGHSRPRDCCTQSKQDRCKQGTAGSGNHANRAQHVWLKRLWCYLHRGLRARPSGERPPLAARPPVHRALLCARQSPGVPRQPAPAFLSFRTQFHQHQTCYDATSGNILPAVLLCDTCLSPCLPFTSTKFNLVNCNGWHATG